MAIPSNVTAELSNLQAQVTANTPLANAPRATITAMQLNADKLVSDINTALVSCAGTLDTWTSPTDPVAISNGILGLLSNAKDENNLALMGGVVGRAAANLDQLP
jgi:hypothetical protein